MLNILSNIKKIVFLLFLIFVVSFTVALEPSQSNTTVNLGLIDFDTLEQSNIFFDYGRDLANVISKKTKWNFNYIDLKSLEQKDILKQLDSNLCDLVPYVQKTEDLQQKYLFSSTPVGKIISGIFTNIESEELIFEDFEVLSKIKIGISKKHINFSNIVEQVKQKGFYNSLVFFDNNDDLILAQQEKRIDAYITYCLTAQSNTKILYRFTPEPIYVVSKKTNTKLMSILNTTIQKIILEEPEVFTDLNNFYFQNANIIPLTKAEKDYIKTLRTINVGLPQNSTNFSRFSKSKNQFEGILPDILNQISQWTGINFNFVKLPNRFDVTDIVKNNNIDFLPHDSYNKFGNINHILSTSNEIISACAWIYTPINQSRNFDVNKIYKIGSIYACECNKKYLNQRFPNIQLIKYDDIEEILSKIEDGHLNGILLDEHSARWLTSLGIFDGFVEISDFKIKAYASFYYNFNVDSRLTQIIDKALYYISKEKINHIISKNTYVQNENITFSMFIHKHPKLFISSIFFIILLIMLVIFFANNYQNKKNQAQILEAKNNELAEVLHKTELDALTGIYNSIVTTKKCNNYLQDSSNNTCAIIILDIDNLNKMNILFGYNYGDEIIQNISSNLNKLFPDAEFYGRIGSDKFLCFFNNTNKQIIKNNIDIYNNNYPMLFSKRNTYKITCCLGIAFAIAGTTDYYKILSDANEALKVAKANGKNQYYIYDI